MIIYYILNKVIMWLHLRNLLNDLLDRLNVSNINVFFNLIYKSIIG
jgi:hypothetical protein